MAIIFIRKLKIKTFIGVLDFEKESKQTLQIDVKVKVNISKSVKSDNIDDACNYASIVDEIESFAENSNYELLETFGFYLKKTLKDKFKVKKIKIKITKFILYKTKGVGIII